MGNLWIGGFVIGGFVIVVLTILGLRGRFGTPSQQGEFDLDWLANSEEVPRRTLRKERATCRGHSLRSRAIQGAGVLWLTDDTLGFVLRTPRRHMKIQRSTVVNATVSATYHRIGIDETSDGRDFLVVEWDSDEGPATIAFQLADAQSWADDITRVSR